MPRSEELPLKPMAFGSGRRVGLATGLIVVLLAVVTVWSVPRPTGDLYVALAAGRDFLDGKGGELDDWSFSTEGRIWVDQNWGTHMLYYVANALGGETGLLVLKMLLLVAGTGFLVLACRQRGVGWPVALVVSGAIIAAGRSFIDLRPNLTTLMFAPVMLHLLYRTRGRPKRYWLVMVVFGVVWANLHGGFFFGLLVMGLWALCMVVPDLLAAWGSGRAEARPGGKRPKDKHTPASAPPLSLGAVLRRDWPFFAATAGAIVLAGVVTPYGIHNLGRHDTSLSFWEIWNLTHPLVVGGSAEWRSVIEWNSIFTASTRTFGTSWEFFLIFGVFSAMVSAKILLKLGKREPLALLDAALVAGFVLLLGAAVIKAYPVWWKFQTDPNLSVEAGAAGLRTGWLVLMPIYTVLALFALAATAVALGALASRRGVLESTTARDVGMVVFDVFMAGLGAVMAFKARRFIPLSLLLAAPLVGMQLQWMVRRIRAAGWITAAVGVVVLVLTAWQLRTNLTYYLPNSPMVREKSILKNMIVYRVFPPGPRNFINDNGVSGRVFNEWRWEGYLHWYCPQLKLFLGGRAQQVYALETYQLQKRILTGLEHHSMLHRLGVQWIVVPLNDQYQRLMQLGVYMKYGTWVPVYCDGENIVLTDSETPVGKRFILACLDGKLKYTEPLDGSKPSPAIAALSRAYCQTSFAVAKFAPAIASAKESIQHRPILGAYMVLAEMYGRINLALPPEIDYLEKENERLSKMNFLCYDGVEILRCRYQVLRMLNSFYKGIKSEADRQRVIQQIQGVSALIDRLYDEWR